MADQNSVNPATSVVEDLLAAAPGDDETRAQAWQAFHGTGSQEDFENQIHALNLPNETKSRLWQLKTGAVSPGAARVSWLGGQPTDVGPKPGVGASAEYLWKEAKAAAPAAATTLGSMLDPRTYYHFAVDPMRALFDPEAAREQFQQDPLLKLGQKALDISKTPDPYAATLSELSPEVVGGAGGTVVGMGVGGKLLDTTTGKVIEKVRPETPASPLAKVIQPQSAALGKPTVSATVAPAAAPGFLNQLWNSWRGKATAPPESAPLGQKPVSAEVPKVPDATTSPARTLPGMHTPEVTAPPRPEPAAPIPSREGLALPPHYEPPSMQIIPRAPTPEELSADLAKKTRAAVQARTAMKMPPLRPLPPEITPEQAAAAQQATQLTPEQAAEGQGWREPEQPTPPERPQVPPSPEQKQLGPAPKEVEQAARQKETEEILARNRREHEAQMKNRADERAYATGAAIPLPRSPLEQHLPYDITAPRGFNQISPEEAIANMEKWQSMAELGPPGVIHIPERPEVPPSPEAEAPKPAAAAKPVQTEFQFPEIDHTPAADEAAARRPGATPEGETVKLSHYSQQAGLTETDPTKQGTGQRGEEVRRAGEEGYVPRTYFGMEGYREPRIVRQPYQYTAEVPKSSLYDIEADPDGIWKKFKKSAGATRAEQEIQKAGYKGYYSPSQKVAAVFEPTKITPAYTDDLAGQMAKNHNQLRGFTYNESMGGFVRDQPVFSVAGEHSNLDKVVKGRTITSADVQEFLNRPEVKKVLASDPRFSVGGYVTDNGNSTIEISKTFDNREAAVAEGKRLNQESIYDHKNRQVIPLGGTAAKDAEAAAGLGAAEKPAPLTDSEARRLEKRVGPVVAAHLRANPDEMFEKALMGAKGEQLAQFANDNGFFKPGASPYEEKGWTAADFSRKGIKTGELAPNKRFVLEQVLTHGLRNEFVNSVLGEEGGPALTAPPEGHVPPPATMRTARMSNEELLAHGFTQDDIDNGRHLPPVSGGNLEKMAEDKGIPPEFAQHMTAEEIKGVEKLRGGVDKFMDTMAKLPSVQEFIDIATQGQAARKWYQRSTAALDEMMKAAPKYFDQPGDREKFLGMLAGSSPRQSVAMNLREALGGWKDWVDAGRPELNVETWKDYAANHRGSTAAQWKPYKMMDDAFAMGKGKVPNIIKALSGEDMWPDLTKNKNFKAPSFNRNLNGWLNYSTNDGWMAMFGGLDPRELSSPTSYHPLSVVTRMAAQALGWEPAEAQAAVWAFTQALSNLKEGGFPTEAVSPEIIRQYTQDFRDILGHDQIVRDLLDDLGVSREQLDAKLTALGEKPEVTLGATPTTAHSIRQLEGRVESARASGKAPAPKIEGQGRLFEPPARAPVDLGVQFNPAEFGERPGMYREPSMQGARAPEVVRPRQRAVALHPSGGFPAVSHAGGGVASVEEISRGVNNYVVPKAGSPTYHGVRFAPEDTPAGATHVSVRPDGSYLVNAGPDLTPAQEAKLRQALGKPVKRAY